MGIVRKILGPKSKYDSTLPYTYVAKTAVIEGDDSLFNHYFADTICGLIEYLNEHNIKPEDVQLFGCYRDKEIPIDKKFCLSETGSWLKRPKICHSLETHYKESMEEQYKGHIELSECSFEDRNREGSGPY